MSESLWSQFEADLASAFPDQLHLGYIDYVPEVPLASRLGTHMSLRGWHAETRGIAYAGDGGRPDLRCSSRDAAFSVTLEIKYFVLDWPSRQGAWNGSLARQHLGIAEGKPNNAVHDVRQKLPLALGSTHVGFLLIAFGGPGTATAADIDRFISAAGLRERCWRHSASSWAHPTNGRHTVHRHLWTRPM